MVAVMMTIMGKRLLSITFSQVRNFSTKAATKPKYSRKSKPKINWTDEQKNIISEAQRGMSVFITGSGGTGKTLLLEEIIKELKKVHGRSKVFVTAATGVAACALKGQTLHSFAGVKHESDPEDMLARARSDSQSRRRWNKVEALVIDEISMVDAHLFDNLEFVARKIRDVDEVWGGIQLIVSGDFFQLPPIIDRSRSRRSSWKQFAFEADCWKSSFDLKFQLTEVFRQKDCRLIKLLQGIRRGENDPEDLELLQECCSKAKPDPSVVQLYPMKEDVKKVNDEQMKALSEGKKLVTYKAADSGENDVWKRQLNLGSAPEELTLCEGARVMLVKNLNPFKQLVNGATGTITGFADPKQCPDLKDIHIADDICHTSVLPVVKFDSGREMVIKPELWYVKEGDRILAQRKQVPLVLAWAISIHKCQGATLDKLHADLSRAFGYGMVYVALSRVRSLDGLYLSGFDPSKIMAHPKVLDFYHFFYHEENDTDEDEGKDDEFFVDSDSEDFSDDFVKDSVDDDVADGGCNSTNLIEVSDESMNRGRERFICYLKIMR